MTVSSENRHAPSCFPVKRALENQAGAAGNYVTGTQFPVLELGACHKNCRATTPHWGAAVPEKRNRKRQEKRWIFILLCAGGSFAGMTVSLENRPVDQPVPILCAY